jgi:hypothetical protein
MVKTPFPCTQCTMDENNVFTILPLKKKTNILTFDGRIVFAIWPLGWEIQNQGPNWKKYM